MKKYLSILMIAVLAVFASCSDNDDEVVAVTSVSLNKTALILPVGEKEKLVATIFPENATDRVVSWISSDNTVANIDDEGRVTAITLGTAVITATVSGKSAQCTVTVSTNFVAITSISLNKNTLTLAVDGEEALIATISPTDASDKTITWSSSDTKVATVDNVGKVKAIAEGTTEITAMAGNQTANCIVTITKEGGKDEQAEVRFKSALYGMKYAISLSTDYNDLGMKPKNVGGNRGWVFYAANGALEFLEVDLYYDLKINQIMRIPFKIDIGRRPAAMCLTKSTSISTAAVTALKNGTYDFGNDPANVLAYFGGYMGNSKFSSLTELRKITNNPGITEAVYNSINFAINCYKVIIYDKNKSGNLIGKYIGYVLYDAYIYWCVDPDNANFGKRLTTALP